MPAVSLKDLMNPLSKIEEHTKSTSEKLTKIEELLIKGLSGSNTSGSNISALVTNQNAMISAQSTMLNQLNEQIKYLRGLGSRDTTNIGTDALIDGQSVIIDIKRKMLNQLNEQTKYLQGLDNLTNSLFKIEESAKFTLEKLTKIEKALTGGLSSGNTAGFDINTLIDGQDVMIDIQSTMLTQLNTQTKYLQVLAKGGKSLSNLFGSSDKNNQGSERGAMLLQQLGIGVKELGKGMIVWSLVPKKSITKLSIFITDTFAALASQDSKKVKEGVNILDMMGGAIFKFSSSLAMSAILLIPGIIAIPFLIGSIGIMSGLMSLIGGRDMSKRIRRGTRSLDRIGDAILSFGIGLAAFALTTLFIVTQPGILVGMLSSILLVGGAVALLGGKSTSKRIRRGSLSLGLLGAGLSVFSVGYGLFTLATAKTNIDDVLIQSAVILGIGVASALVGKFGLQNSAVGAAAMALNGLGLLVFSLGYVPFSKATDGMKLEDIVIQSGILLGIGTVMSLAGIAVAATGGTALLGPVLFAAAGGSLLLLAPGLKAMKSLDYSEQDSIDLATTLGAVAMAFSGITPGGGIFNTIGGLFTRVIQSGTGIAASAMYASAGLSLQELSKGLSTFKSINFTEDDSKELAVALGSVSSAFAQAGGEPSNPGGLFGTVFGNTFSPNATERGIKSVMNAGDALIEITKGLSSFLDLRKKYGLTSESFSEGGFLNNAVKETLGFVQSSFAAIADEGNVQAGGFFGSLFGVNQNKVAEGIESVTGAGKELNNIIEGLVGFLDLKNKQGLTSESFTKGGFLNTAVIETLGFVQSAFAAIGGEETVDAGGFFGSVFNIKKNKVAKGIDAVKGSGKELTNIALGLKSFKQLIDKDIDFSENGKLANAVLKSLTFVGSAFAKIGGQEKEDSWFIFDWDENIINKGIKAVKGAGSQLKDISLGLKSFQQLIDKDIDFSENGKLANAVKNSLTFVGDAFAVIGGKESSDSSFFGLIKWDEQLVEKGIESVNGAGKALTDIAEGLIKFTELKNPTSIVNSISLLLQGISDVFINTYNSDKEFSSHIDDFRRLINDIGSRAADGDLEKAAKDMKSMAEAINNVDLQKAEAFGSLFKGAADVTTNGGIVALQALADAVSEIRDILTNEDSAPNSTATTGAVNTLGSPSNVDNTQIQTSLNRINSTLSSLNTTMNSLPGNIAAIEIKIPQE